MKTASSDTYRVLQQEKFCLRVSIVHNHHQKRQDTYKKVAKNKNLNSWNFLMTPSQNGSHYKLFFW